MARKKKRPVIKVQKAHGGWMVTVTYPFKVHGVVPSHLVGWYKRRLHADNLAERLDAELVDAEMK